MLSRVRLCDPMDCSLPASSVHGIFQAIVCPWDFPGNSTEVDCHFLLQGIFPTQGPNPGLPHCRQTLYRLNRQGSLEGWRQSLRKAAPAPWLSPLRCSRARGAGPGAAVLLVRIASCREQTGAASERMRPSRTRGCSASVTAPLATAIFGEVRLQLHFRVTLTRN